MSDEIQQLNELFAALAKAQMEMTNASKNVDNAYLKSKYADLSSVMDAARPYLAKNGLAVLQRMIVKEGDLYLQSILGHSSGQYIESTVRVDVKEAPAGAKTNYYHALGSGLSYLRRYQYAALVGVAVGTEDTDGNDAVPQGYKPPLKAMHGGSGPLAAGAIIPLINAEELKTIEEMIGGDDDLLSDVLNKAKIGKLADLPASRYQGLMNWLDGSK